MIPTLSKLSTNPILKTSKIGVFYGNSDEATRYQGIVFDLMLIGDWVSFMSKGVGFQYSYNTGYSGRMVSLRYFPRKIAVKDIPNGFPTELNTGLNSVKDIRSAVETSHITGIDGFYYGIFGLVKRVVEAIRLQEISQGTARLSAHTVNLEWIVEDASVNANRRSSKVGMCVVQKLSPILRGEGGYDFVPAEGMVLSSSDLETLAFLKMVEYLQTTFIELGTRYEAGEGDLSDYENLSFTWHINGQLAQLTGKYAALARFDRRARRFFHPFTSATKSTRGLEVVTHSHLYHIFDANVIRQMRLQHPFSIPQFHVEMAARLFFLVVHPLEIYHANEDHYDGWDNSDTYYSPRAKQTVNGRDILRPDKTTPLTQDAVVFLREFYRKLEDNGQKKRHVYGRSELALFPVEYETQAIELYQRMVRLANDGKRYVGVCGCDPTYSMTWLEFDLNPTRAEGTLHQAIEDFERVSEDEEDDN